jgi:hypothetical protein
MSDIHPPTTWIMAKDREWTTEPGGPVDRALTVLAELKSAYDAEMDFILVDTQQRRTVAVSQEMATICFYIVVKDKHDEIEPKLQEVGLLRG